MKRVQIRLSVRQLKYFLLLLAVFVGFQNCGPGFKANNEGPSQDSSSEIPLANGPSTLPPESAPAPSPAPASPPAMPPAVNPPIAAPDVPISVPPAVPPASPINPENPYTAKSDPYTYASAPTKVHNLSPEPAASPIPVKTYTNTQALVSPKEGNDQTEKLEAGLETAAGFVKSKDGWARVEPGAYLEFRVDAKTEATHGFSFLYTSQTSGTVVDIYVNEKLIGKHKIVNTSASFTNSVRSAQAVARLTKGINKIKLITGPQQDGFTIRDVQVNFPKNDLADFAKVQILDLALPTRLQLNAPSDFYRQAMNKEAWDCAWTFCYVEFTVQLDKPMKFAATVDYVQQSVDVHACAAFHVNGSEQAVFQMKSPTGKGITSPQTLTLPAGISRLKVANHNYFNNVFCFGAQFNEIKLTPLP